MKSKNKIYINFIDSKQIIYDSVVNIDFRLKIDTDEDFVKLRMRVYDPFFNINYMPYYHDCVYDKKCDNFNWFISIGGEKDNNFEKFLFRGGIRVTFEDLSTSEIILDETFKFNFKLFEYRNRIQHNESFFDKRLWIIGDSHVWHTFGGTTDSYVRSIAGYIPVRYSHPSLSLNRFIKGDHFGFLNVLPIHKDDILLFCLGEIDLRYSVFKTHFNKKIDLEFLTKNLVSDYFKTLEVISKQFINNKIFIISPNPPCRDNYINPELSEFVLGSETNRLFCYNIFKDCCKKHCIINNKIKFIDWTEKYSDPDGFLLKSKFYTNDIHVKDASDAINFINDFIHTNLY